MSTTARIPVSLSIPVPSGQTVTVQYATSNDTAQAPADYIAASGVLTFTSGQQNKTFDITLVEQTTPQPDKTFRVTFSDPQGPQNFTVSIVGNPIRTVLVPGSASAEEPDDYLNRFLWVWDRLHDPKNLYMSSYEFGVQRYLPPMYVSGLDSMIIVEDRLHNNSIDNGLQQTSETMSFMTGMRYWRDILVGDNPDDTTFNISGPELYIQSPLTPNVPNPFSPELSVNYTQAVLERDSVFDYPLEPSPYTNQVGDDVFAKTNFKMLSCNIFDFNNPSIQFIKPIHGYVTETIRYLPQSNIASARRIFERYVSGGPNNTVGTATRGRYESVYQTLVPHSESQLAELSDVSNFVKPEGQHFRYFVTTVGEEVDNDQRLISYHRKYRNNPYADQAFLQWNSLATYNLFDAFDEVIYVGRNATLGIYDTLSYNLYDKYFRTVGNGTEAWTVGQPGSAFLGLVNMSYEVDNYNTFYPFAGGKLSIVFACSSECHHAFQNPMASYALSGSIAGSALSIISPATQTNFTAVLPRQIVLLRWLQSPEGPIAGGVTNSYLERYAIPDDGRENATFGGMYYTYAPGKVNPPSNDRVDWQTMGRLGTAEYFQHLTQIKNPQQPASQPLLNVEVILDRLVLWFLNNTTVTGATFSVPKTIRWTSNNAVVGQTATTPNSEGVYEFLPTMLLTDSDISTLASDNSNVFWSPSQVPNPNLHCSITESGVDLGIATSLAYVLINYAKGKQRLSKLNTNIGASTLKPSDALSLAKDLLDVIWNNYRDMIGITNEELRPDYIRIFDEVPLPTANINFVGESMYGIPLDPNGGFGPRFIDLRPFLSSDPKFSDLEAYFNDPTQIPSFTYHRTWVQCMFGMANGAMHKYFS